jgi:hypothetical protein
MDNSSIDNIETNKPDELDKQELSKPLRDEKGRLLPGNTANPSGRPKGKTLKEWLRDKLAEMNEEERKDYLKTIPKELQWQMAEGRPSQDNNTNLQGEINIRIAKDISDKYDSTSEPSSNSEGQEPV